MTATRPAAMEIPGARRWCWSLASVSIAAVIALSVVVLLAWAVRFDALHTVAGGSLGMKANTAICFILLGVALWLRRRPGALGDLAQYVAGAVAIGIGALTALEYVVGASLGLDELLFSDSTGVLGNTDPPGRMAPATAACLVILGTAFVIRAARARSSRGSSALVALAALLAFVAFVGNIYDANALYGAFTQMKVDTSVGLLLLCFAAVAIAPQEGFAAVLLSAAAGGVAARRLAPAVVLLPICIGAVVLWGERAGIYDAAFGILLLVVTVVIAFGAIAAWVTWTLGRERTLRIDAERRADTDLLTGLRSRGAIVAELERIVASSGSGSAPFSVLAIDGDGLKQMNDRHGHASGDAALLRLGELVVATLRETDLIGRIGGDEFLALLPRTTASEAMLVAERLRRALVPAELSHLMLAASVGVSHWADGVTAGELLLAADAALYAEKHSRAVAS